MKFCPFCGSPAAAWPEYASDYVRGYPLCEHHMKPIVERATIHIYDPFSEAFEKRWDYLQEKMGERLSELLDECNNNLLYFPPSLVDKYKMRELRDVWVIDRCGSSECEVADRYHDSVIDHILPGSPITKGDPIESRIDEEEVDRLIAIRISSFASDVKKGVAVRRCSAEKINGSDRRCINRVKQDGSLCRSCIQRKESAINTAIGPDKVNEIIGVIYEQPQNH